MNSKKRKASTAPGGGDPFATPPRPPAATTAKRWRCDVCLVAIFDDYDVAVAHEVKCAASAAAGKSARSSVVRGGGSNRGAGGANGGDGANSSNASTPKRGGAPRQASVDPSPSESSTLSTPTALARLASRGGGSRKKAKTSHSTPVNNKLTAAASEKAAQSVEGASTAAVAPVAAAAALTPKPSKPSKSYGYVWQCSFCEVATFDKYEEAVEHEKQCSAREDRAKKTKNEPKNRPDAAAQPATTSSATKRSKSGNKSNGDSKRKVNWRCDVCLVAVFDSYEKAVAHENNCTNYHPKSKVPRRDREDATAKVGTPQSPPRLAAMPPKRAVASAAAPKRKTAPAVPNQEKKDNVKYTPPDAALPQAKPTPPQMKKKSDSFQRSPTSAFSETTTRSPVPTLQTKTAIDGKDSEIKVSAATAGSSTGVVSEGVAESRSQGVTPAVKSLLLGSLAMAVTVYLIQRRVLSTLLLPDGNDYIKSPIIINLLLLLSALAIVAGVMSCFADNEKELPPVMESDAPNPTLREFLSDPEGFHLALAPAFFGFFAYFGALAALEEETGNVGLIVPRSKTNGSEGGGDGSDTCRLKSVAGASAGAMAAVLLASGGRPRESAEFVTKVTWGEVSDFPGLFGYAKGNIFESLMRLRLNESKKEAFGNNSKGDFRLEEALIPVAVSAFDILRLKEVILTNGCMAKAARASAGFPGLFQPVPWLRRGEDEDNNGEDKKTWWKAIKDYFFLVDGGITDGLGLNGLDSLPSSDKKKRVINMHIGEPWCQYSSSNNTNFSSLVSIAIVGSPMCGPWAMQNGPRAVESVRKAMAAILDEPMERRLSAKDARGQYFLRADASKWLD